MPPELEHTEVFPIIIGTDVIYEPLHAELVANVVSRRLAPGGRCILCCGVRIQASAQRQWRLFLSVFFATGLLLLRVQT